MKKLYTTLFLMLIAMGISAQGWKEMNRPMSKAQKLNPMESLKTVQVKPSNIVRKAESTSYEGITATSATTWYYADLAGNGTAAYYVMLSTNGITNGGIPEGPGYMARVEIFADPLEDPNEIVLPTGIYSIVDEPEYALGEVYASNTQFLDCFWNPDKEEGEELVGYVFYGGSKGTLTIDKDDKGIYTINLDMDFDFYDSETYDLLKTDHVTMSYTGEMTYKDKDASKYTPIEGDYTLNIPNASGRYTNSGYGYGNYSIAFYSDGLIDDEGWVVGTGDLFNVELLADDVTPADYSKLAGTYEYQDFNGGVFTPGHYVGGCYYNYYGSYFAMGTCLDEYTEDGQIIGLATGGTIKVEDKGDGIFHFDFNLTTPEGATLTGQWEGELKKYITDYTDGIIAAAASSDSEVKVLRGTIYVDSQMTGNVSVFTANGAKVGSARGSHVEINTPSKGLYFVKCGDKTQKVLVK